MVTRASAEVLLSISSKNLKGQQTVGSCLAKGDRGAGVDKSGLVRIFTPEEIELTKRLNPKVFFGRLMIKERLPQNAFVMDMQGFPLWAATTVSGSADAPTGW